MEDYAAKMVRKPLAEVKRYLTHWAEYREAAVVAAIDELVRRGEALPADTDALRARLQAEAARVAEIEEAENARLQAETRRAAADEGPVGGFFGVPTPDPDDEPTEQEEAPGAPHPERPHLYSPTVILWFSVLFSFFTGGVLMALNLHRMRKYAAVWMVAAFCALYGVAVYSLRGSLGTAGNFLNLPAALVFNLWFWPRYIGFGRDFKPRNFVWPLIICLVLTGAMFYWAVQHGLVPNPFNRPLPAR